MTYATPEKTAQWSTQFPALTYSKLGQTDLTVSQAGVGTYRMLRGVSEHEEALQFALEMGINLIDTSTNYGDGDAERLIGDILQDHYQASKISREQLVLVSKAGYVQGQNWSQFQIQKNNGEQWPEAMELDQGLAYCMHPIFLEQQLTQSLARLQESVLDVFLIHNPEYTLQWAKMSGQSLEEARALFEDRLEKAFLYLETEVEKGRIQYYGISSNTFGHPSEYYEFVSLNTILDRLEKIKPDHHFKVIQFPLNLLETGAVTCVNQPKGNSVLDEAFERGVGVLVNRPLNALNREGSLQRLVDYEVEDVVEDQLIRDAVIQLKDLESLFETRIQTVIRFSEDRHRDLFKQALFQADSLEHSWSRFNSFAHWREALTQVLWPNLELGVHLLSFAEQEESVMEWLESVLAQFNRLVHLVSLYYKERSTHEGEVIKAAVRASDPDWAIADSLGHMALRALRTTQGISTVLVGMRQLLYVEDVLSELAQSAEVRYRTPSWQKLEETLNQ